MHWRRFCVSTKSKNYMMDEATKKLRTIHTVTEWLLRHAGDIPGPDEIFQKIGEEYIPYNIRMMLFELVRQDFANAITPTVMWKAIAKQDGILADGIETELD